MRRAGYVKAQSRSPAHFHNAHCPIDVPNNGLCDRAAGWLRDPLLTAAIVRVTPPLSHAASNADGSRDGTSANDLPASEAFRFWQLSVKRVAAVTDP
jgi:hypothetical protein